MKTSLRICTNRRFGQNPSCGGRGSEEVMERLAQRGWTVEASPCMGYCAVGPNLRVAPGGKMFHNVTPDTLDDLIAELDLLPDTEDSVR